MINVHATYSPDTEHHVSQELLLTSTIYSLQFCHVLLKVSDSTTYAPLVSLIFTEYLGIDGKMILQWTLQK